MCNWSLATLKKEGRNEDWVGDGVLQRPKERSANCLSMRKWIETRKQAAFPQVQPKKAQVLASPLQGRLAQPELASLLVAIFDHPCVTFASSLVVFRRQLPLLKLST